LSNSDAPAGASKYRLKFLPAALDEWEALDGSAKAVLKKLLKKRLEQPRVPGAELHGVHATATRSNSANRVTG
jgi:mRNA interferase RelE/StbE